MSFFFCTIPQNVALILREKYRLNTFVETGTYVGTTAKWASSHFDSVYTVESFEEYYRAAELKLANLRNIHMFLQDSLLALPGILVALETEHKRPLFYLDAHWSETAHYGKPLVLTSALEEIKLINQWSYNHDYAIVVDDAHKFGTDGWPAQEDVLDALDNGGRRRVRELLDVYIATPLEAEKRSYTLSKSYRDTYLCNSLN